jgi:hypothetical protein
MRTVLLLAVLGSCWALAAQATVYRWVDADGVVHFSDQPHQGASEIQVQEPQTYSAPKAAPANNSGAAAAAAAAKAKASNFRYTNCSVGSPAPESDLTDADSVAVSVSLDPAPRPTDHISVYYDGAPVAGSGGASTGFQISPLERGTHTLAVTVTDTTGAIMCQSGPVTFYVHQPSLLAPQNPNSPANRTLPTIH